MIQTQTISGRTFLSVEVPMHATKLTIEKDMTSLSPAILVGCERSGAVTQSLRDLGYEAFSCDTEPSYGPCPEYHIQADVFEVIASRQWSGGIFFPPCTHLAISGARSFATKIADGRQQAAIDFFMRIVNCGIPKISIENPVGIMSTRHRKPDQIIHPYQFGDPEIKRTCLWLKGLPLLTPTNIVEPEYVLYRSKKSKSGFSKWGKITGTHPSTKNPKNATLRSQTYPGIAHAMASQWGPVFNTPEHK